MDKCSNCKKEDELAYYGRENFCQECYIKKHKDRRGIVEAAAESVELSKDDLAFASNLKRTSDQDAPSLNFLLEMSLNTDALRKQCKGKTK